MYSTERNKCTAQNFTRVQHRMTHVYSTECHTCIQHRMSYMYSTEQNMCTTQNVTRVQHRMSHVYSTERHMCTAQNVTGVQHRTSQVYSTERHICTAQNITCVQHRMSHVYITEHHTCTASCGRPGKMAHMVPSQRLSITHTLTHRWRSTIDHKASHMTITGGLGIQPESGLHDDTYLLLSEKHAVLWQAVLGKQFIQISICPISTNRWWEWPNGPITGFVLWCCNWHAIKIDTQK